MSRPVKRILLIRLSSLGDILHALPALSSLRSSYPSARIDWLVESRMAFLLGAVPGIDAVRSIDTRGVRRRPWSLREWNRLRRTLSDLRRSRYDLAIDLQGLVKTALLAVASGARRRFGFSAALARERPAAWFYHEHLTAPPGRMHVARLNLELARAAGGGPADLCSPLRATPEVRARVDALLEDEQLSRFAVINPGGGWYTKRWPPEKYAALAARIEGELHLPTVVVTGPGEGHLYTKIVAAGPGPRPRHLALGFLELVPLLERARLFVGGDTGPLHLASALGTPVVAIFGPTSPERNGPLGSRDETVVHRLPCSFCYGRTCPTQNECMDIEVGEVFDAVVRRLAGPTGGEPESGGRPA